MDAPWPPSPTPGATELSITALPSHGVCAENHYHIVEDKGAIYHKSIYRLWSTAPSVFHTVSDFIRNRNN